MRHLMCIWIQLTWNRKNLCVMKHQTNYLLKSIFLQKFEKKKRQIWTSKSHLKLSDNVKFDIELWKKRWTNFALRSCLSIKRVNSKMYEFWNNVASNIDIWLSNVRYTHEIKNSVFRNDQRLDSKIQNDSRYWSRKFNKVALLLSVFSLFSFKLARLFPSEYFSMYFNSLCIFDVESRIVFEKLAMFAAKIMTCMKYNKRTNLWNNNVSNMISNLVILFHCEWFKLKKKMLNKRKDWRESRIVENIELLNRVLKIFMLLYALKRLNLFRNIWDCDIDSD